MAKVRRQKVGERAYHHLNHPSPHLPTEATAPVIGLCTTECASGKNNSGQRLCDSRVSSRPHHRTKSTFIPSNERGGGRAETRRSKTLSKREPVTGNATQKRPTATSRLKHEVSVEVREACRVGPPSSHEELVLRRNARWQKTESSPMLGHRTNPIIIGEMTEESARSLCHRRNTDQSGPQAPQRNKCEAGERDAIPPYR